MKKIIWNFTFIVALLPMPAFAGLSGISEDLNAAIEQGTIADREATRRIREESEVDKFVAASTQGKIPVELVRNADVVETSVAETTVPELRTPSGSPVEKEEPLTSGSNAASSSGSNSISSSVSESNFDRIQLADQQRLLEDIEEK